MLPVGWKRYTVQDAVEALIDYRGITPIKSSKGIPLITAKIIKDGRINTPNEFIEESAYETWMRRGLPKFGDVVVTTEAPLGEVAQINTHEKIALAQRVVTLRGRSGVIDNSFLKYFLLSPIGQRKLKARETGTTVTGIKQSELRQIEIYAPEYEKQLAIAEILTSLDDKIELNLQMNKTLEAIAQALYKEWFVDFRVPGFDGELIDEVPKAWSKKHIGSLFSYDVGGDWGKEVQQDDHHFRVAIIRGTDFNNVKKGDISKVPIRYIKKSDFEKKKVIHGDILLEISGGSPDQPTGRTILCTDIILKMFDCPVVPASFCRLIRPFNFNHSIFLSTFLSYFYDRGGTWEYQNQSTGISNFQFRYFAENKLIALPEDWSIINEFGSKIFPLIEKSSINIIQVSILSNLRNTILPKLMTGKLEVLNYPQK